MKKPDQLGTMEHRPETSSLYFRLKEKKIDRSVQVDPESVKVVLDLDPEGEVVGIELIGLLKGASVSGTLKPS